MKLRTYLPTTTAILCAAISLALVSHALAATTNAPSSYPKASGVQTLDLIPIESTNATSGGFNLKVATPKVFAAGIEPFLTNGSIPNLVAPAGALPSIGGPFAVTRSWDLDDDYNYDYDDDLNLALAFALQDANLGSVSGIISSISSNSWHSAAEADTWARFYSRGSVAPAIASSYSGTSFGANITTNGYSGYFASNTIGAFPHTISRFKDVQPALSFYRRQLATCPSNSVDLMFGGAYANLSDLYNSTADSISPLTGLQLIKRGARCLIGIDSILPKTWSTNDANQLSNLGLEAWSALVVSNDFTIPFYHFDIYITNANGYCGDGLTNRPAGALDLAVSNRYFALTGPAAYSTRPYWAQQGLLFSAFGTNFWGTNAFWIERGYFQLGQIVGSICVITNSFITNGAGNHYAVYRTQPDWWYASNIDRLYGMAPKMEAAFVSVPAQTNQTYFSNELNVTGPKSQATTNQGTSMLGLTRPTDAGVSVQEKLQLILGRWNTTTPTSLPGSTALLLLDNIIQEQWFDDLRVIYGGGVQMNTNGVQIGQPPGGYTGRLLIDDRASWQTVQAQFKGVANDTLFEYGANEDMYLRAGAAAGKVVINDSGAEVDIGASAKPVIFAGNIPSIGFTNTTAPALADFTNLFGSVWSKTNWIVRNVGAGLFAYGCTNAGGITTKQLAP